jgi:dolichol-phosphate mannosyltransferase
MRGYPVPELSIIVPTLNERDNVAVLVKAVQRALAGVDYEIVFVDDDSHDGTAACARQIAQVNPRVRVVQRVGRRGLSSAAVEGMLATSAPYLAVMDGDLQHDERVLPRMLDTLRATDVDLVVGTRNIAGGGMGNFAPLRVALSQAGRALSRAVCKTELSDPMSGFFAIRRTFLDEVVRNLSLTGFKILVDIVASAEHPARVAEIPYTFRDRKQGESKLDTLVAFEYVSLLIDKLTNGWLPVTYLTFGMVGGLGVLLNALLLHFLMLGRFSFEVSQALAGVAVIPVNFFLNNIFTFRFHRLRRTERWIGLSIFFCACVVGLFLNVRFAAFLNHAGISPLVSGAAGILTGSVWNYWIASIFVWRVGRVRRSARGRAERLNPAAYRPDEA